MSQTTHTSFSLLNQQEIDTLVKFLTDKKNTVDSDVMSQNSIDKLIQLIRTEEGRMILGASSTLDSNGITALKKLQFRDSATEVCELRCSIQDETGYVELSICNTKQDKTYPLTTDIFDAEDDNGWGRAIPPIYFTQLAGGLSLKFTQDTYNTVCRIFAKQNYGSEEHEISPFYLPDNEALLKVLL